MTAAAGNDIIAIAAEEPQVDRHARVNLNHIIAGAGPNHEVVAIISGERPRLAVDRHSHIARACILCHPNPVVAVSGINDHLAVDAGHGRFP